MSNSKISSSQAFNARFNARQAYMMIQALTTLLEAGYEGDKQTLSESETTDITATCELFEDHIAMCRSQGDTSLDDYARKMVRAS